MSLYNGTRLFSVGFIFFILSNNTYAITANNTFVKPILALPKLTNTQLAQVALGQALFNDESLSNNKKISCSTCHIADKGYADGLAFSKDKHGNDKEYNTPSIEYSTYNYYFGWTGRFNNLQEHLDFVINDEQVMNRSWKDIVNQLRQSVQYQKRFKKSKYESISRITINDAITKYQKTLAKQSRFDLFLLGDKKQITKKEQAGFDLFKNSGCISCHQGINFGGNLRQKFGVMKSYFSDDVTDKRNLGYFNTTNKKEHLHFFRVPSLRNVSKTAPYFHDASAETLEEAIRIMFSYQLGVEASQEDILSIKSFLETLEPIND